jgi:hypothetical protein
VCVCVCVCVYVCVTSAVRADRYVVGVRERSYQIDPLERKLN